jgi:hypothetical protein
MKYVLLRMDDNGLRTIVQESDDYEKLKEMQEEYERRGHKQTYWIETGPNDEGIGPARRGEE